MSEGYESIGRIEVAPEVLVTIARIAVQGVEGVQQMSQVPACLLYTSPSPRD